MYTILHAIVGYFFLLLTVRILSRRPGGQLTLAEFVIVFLIGGVIITATIGDDRSMTNCVCAVITVALLHRLISWLKSRYPTFGAVVDGTPLVLLNKGQWQSEAMRKAHVDERDVMATARTKGLKTLDEIKYAILERNGSISVIKADEKAEG
jgi:uncharacterized membrane protein YcaP (DUF421 family)